MVETQNSDNNSDSDPCVDGDRNTKKVRFKEVVDGEDTNMVVDTNQQPIMSFKDKLLGGGVVSMDENREGSLGSNESDFELLEGDVSRGVVSMDENLEGSLGSNESDFELLEGDVSRSIVNGVQAIAFSDRIKDILFKEMELTVILKLLGRNIGYNDIDDYNKVLTQGPWIIFGQYLTIQPWTKMFNPAQPYPSLVMVAWIRLPGLSGYLYKRKLIEAIGGLIGKVVKLDLQTDNRTRGRFARLVFFINLDMPLVSQVLVDSVVQRVEYEALPTVCFDCGKYSHAKDLCPVVGETSTPGSSVDATVVVF
ncbi:hypothetical protein J1N35_018210 [Gossypium stocksii]|uniref:DUF4283 domain-containing protein n=1 Tax=Gossypium stocksii TaxID=47602 RepID=A0A9D4A6G3_9ROSI|nr:hypothetical protein J1N35_018210 [Gossypium stocksii]